MKSKIYFFALTVMSSFTLQAQSIMNIHQNDGTLLQIPLNTIDSITYTITNTGVVSDLDGNTYTTIVIGTQEWMTENLRTTTYANGDPIPNVTDAIQWDNLTTGAWAHLNNDSQHENSYGKLYNWYTVNDSRNVCPSGWHVPSDAEWTILSDLLGGFTVAGGKMKSTGTQYWLSPNADATNESGFSGMPGGMRYPYGSFDAMGLVGMWWSTTINLTNFYPNLVSMSYNSGILQIIDYQEGYGLSVRCIRD